MALTTSSVHGVTAADITCRTYCDGEQSDLTIGNATIFFDSKSSSTEEGLAALRKLRAETQRLEQHLQAKVDRERRAAAEPQPTAGGYCPCSGVTDFYSDTDRERWDDLHDGCTAEVDALAVPGVYTPEQVA